MPEAALDAFDIHILDLVQENARLTTAEIGAEVGLSASAVQRRLKQLRESGVIEAEIAVIAPEAVGRTVTLIVEVELASESPTVTTSFRQAMRDWPDVMQCYCVTGPSDYILIVTAPDVAAYEQAAEQHLMANPHVRRHTTRVVLGRIKVGLSVPLSPPNGSGAAS